MESLSARVSVTWRAAVVLSTSVYGHHGGDSSPSAQLRELALTRALCSTRSEHSAHSLKPQLLRALCSLAQLSKMGASLSLMRMGIYAHTFALSCITAPMRRQYFPLMASRFWSGKQRPQTVRYAASSGRPLCERKERKPASARPHGLRVFCTFLR